MRRALRVPILVLLPLLLVAGILAESGNGDEETPTGVRLAELTPTAAAAGTLSSTWYCAAGSATGVSSGDGAGPAEQRVIVSNTTDAPSSGVVTFFPVDGAPTAVPIEIGAHGRNEVEVSDHVVAPWAAALVEVSGGGITVAHELTGPTGRSLSDCSSSPSANWYFAGGTTAAGTAMWLALFNPFPGEATVDVSFDTTDGIRTPGDYEGIVIPGGSVVVLKVSDVVTLDAQVATTVSTRTGRIVAEQIQSYEGRDGGTKGLAATLGATAPNPIWSFPAAAPREVETVETVAVFNPGDTDTDVVVQVQLDDPANAGTVEPFEISVPAHRYAVVTVTDTDPETDDRVPAGVPHWIVVSAPDGSDIVAQRSVTPTGGGFTTTVGLPVKATRWLVPAGILADTTVSLVSIANPSPTDTATVTVRRHGSAAASDVDAATELEIAPGERLSIDLLAAGFSGTDSVEVTSDVPVVVGQWLTFADPADAASPVAVPVSGTQSVPEEVVGPSVSEQLSTDEITPTETIVPIDPVDPPGEGAGDAGDTDAGTGGGATDETPTTTTTTAGG